MNFFISKIERTTFSFPKLLVKTVNTQLKREAVKYQAQGVEKV
jgi:hypothetical protein